MLPFAWDDNPSARSGPGISRPLEGERTKSFTLKITLQSAMPMKWKTKAATASKAKQYALARWPGSTVEVLK
jgi:hypothetical protein